VTIVDVQFSPAHCEWAELRDAEELAGRFEVSLLAALWRLYSFGLAARPA